MQGRRSTLAGAWMREPAYWRAALSTDACRPKRPAFTKNPKSSNPRAGIPDPVCNFAAVTKWIQFSWHRNCISSSAKSGLINHPDSGDANEPETFSTLCRNAWTDCL